MAETLEMTLEEMDLAAHELIVKKKMTTPLTEIKLQSKLQSQDENIDPNL
jgi:hypothetical protein